MDVSGKVIKRVRKMAGSVAGSASDVAGSAVDMAGSAVDVAGSAVGTAINAGKKVVPGFGRTKRTARPTRPAQRPPPGRPRTTSKGSSPTKRAGYACDSYEERTSQEGHEREGALGEAFQALQDGPLRSPDPAVSGLPRALDDQSERYNGRPSAVFGRAYDPT